MVGGVPAKTDLVDTIICLTLDQGRYQHISNSDWCLGDNWDSDGVCIPVYSRYYTLYR